MFFRTFLRNVNPLIIPKIVMLSMPIITLRVIWKAQAASAKEEEEH